MELGLGLGLGVGVRVRVGCRSWSEGWVSVGVRVMDGVRDRGGVMVRVRVGLG